MCSASRRVGVEPLDVARQARSVAYEPYGVVGVIGAGSAAVRAAARPDRGRAAGGQRRRLQAGRACGAGGRADRARARAGRAAGGSRADRPRRRRRPASRSRNRASRRSSSPARPPSAGWSQAPASPARRRSRVELGGKDAMLVLADAHLPRAVAAALWAGCAGAGQARGSRRAGVRRARADTSASSPGSCARRPSAARRRSRRPAHAGRPAGLARRRLRARAGARREDALAHGADAALRRTRRPAPLRAGSFYAPAVLTGVTARDAR